MAFSEQLKDPQVTHASIPPDTSGASITLAPRTPPLGATPTGASSSVFYDVTLTVRSRWGSWEECYEYNNKRFSTLPVCSR